jgi:hypothetical protein
MIPGSANSLLLASAAAAGPVQIERSLRFNSSDSAFCSRTPAVAGNRQTWTWAGWVNLRLPRRHPLHRRAALTPSSFTEVSATTGRIEAKLYAGSFGTNGFWLPFNNNSTAAALGTDYSGNSNTWTVNNLSVTAGAGNDSLVDTPTSYGTGYRRG